MKLWCKVFGHKEYKLCHIGSDSELVETDFIKIETYCRRIKVKLCSRCKLLYFEFYGGYHDQP